MSGLSSSRERLAVTRPASVNCSRVFSGAPELGLALGARDRARALEHELAADEALQARAAQEREQLLLERPVEGFDAHSCRKTPITLPISCDVLRVDRLERVVLGLEPHAAVCLSEETLQRRLVGRLVVTGERDDDVAVSRVLRPLDDGDVAVEDARR